MENKQKITEKMAKIKALAERGVGGEKTTALQMYEALKNKYGITDEEVQQSTVNPQDLSKIDLKQFWGITFSMSVIASNLQEENDICAACPHTWNDEQCENCGTYWNIKDLQLEFETMQKRLERAAMEVAG